MNNKLNDRPSYKENLAQAEEQIDYRQAELKKRQKNFSNAQKKYNERRYENEGINNPDYDKMHVINKRVEDKRKELYEAETQLEHRQQKQKNFGVSDEDYYNQRARYLDTQTASWTEKYEKTKAKYEKYSQRNQDLEKNQNMTREAHNKMVDAQHKLNRLENQKEDLVNKGSKQYNYEKRQRLGELAYNYNVDKIADEILKDLKREKPLKVDGKHAEDKVSPTWTDKQREEEERLNRNDPSNKVKSRLKSRRYIDETVESGEMYDGEGDTGAIVEPPEDELYEGQEFNNYDLNVGEKYQGEVIATKHGYSTISFFHGAIEGIIYRGEKLGLEPGAIKRFTYMRQNKQDTPVFELRARAKEKESSHDSEDEIYKTLVKQHD